MSGQASLTLRTWDGRSQPEALARKEHSIHELELTSHQHGLRHLLEPAQPTGGVERIAAAGGQILERKLALGVVRQPTERDPIECGNPLGQFAPRTWAAIACGMLVVLGLWLAGFGLKRPAPLAGLVSAGAAFELLVLSGTLY